MTEEFQLCACGCGKLALPGNRFINGHSGGKKLPKENPKLCKCGCGFYAKSGKDYIFGHHRLKTPWEVKIELKRKLCACGCRKLASPGNAYIHGHQNIGIKHSEEAIEKTKIGLKNNHKNHPEIWEGNYKNMRGGNDIIEHHYIYDHSDLTKYTMKITRKKHTLIHHWMKKCGIEIPHINVEVNENE